MGARDAHCREPLTGSFLYRGDYNVMLKNDRKGTGFDRNCSPIYVIIKKAFHVVFNVSAVNAMYEGEEIELKKFQIASLALTTVIVGSLMGCSQGEKQGKTDAASPPATASEVKVTGYKGGPAELLIHSVNAGITDDQFEKFFVEPLKAKYPEITLVLAKETLDKLIAAGTPPDLVLVSNAGLITVLESDVPEDLNPMVKTHGIDLSKLDQSVVQQTLVLGEQKALYGIPFAMNYGAMVHNRDIFDKFGVPYPKDTMTYEEAYELGKKMTRTEGGTNYIGILPPDLRQMYWQYGLPIYDKAKNKATLTTDKHAKVFSLLNQFYMIPGYIEKGNVRHSIDLFFKEHRMAMYPNWIAAINTYFTNAKSKDAIKWDLTAHPGFSDKPGLGKEVDYHMIVVNKAGKKKDAAYQVIISLLSEDVQTKLSRAGRLSVLKNDNIRKVYGADNDTFTGKNLQSIFKVSPSPLPPASKYDPKINALLNGEVSKNVAVGGIDINTALRNAEDKANKEIIIP